MSRGLRYSAADLARVTQPVSGVHGASPKRVTDLPGSFVLAWRSMAPSYPQPTREHRFHPVRRWRFDLAWPDQLVAVEIDGGTWAKSRHTTGSGFEEDCHKTNAAAVLGWRVLRFTATMLSRRPADCVAVVQAALDLRGQP